MSVAIIGCFYQGDKVSDGQGVKTKILTEEIERVLGRDRVERIDTYRWKKHPLSLLFRCIRAVRKHDNVMFLTDENGTKVFPRLLLLANIAGKCKLHYYVVGGWLDRYLHRSKSAVRNLKKLDAIYVELPAMLRELEKRGFQNGVLVNKFRRMTPVEYEDIDTKPGAPYRLCFFSRVMKEKGIEDAIQAVKEANRRAGFEKFRLDIFGAVNPSYQETFEKMRQNFPTFIRYGGIVDFQSSSAVLKDYAAMLFPTFYTSEGYPNTIVDAFAAGLPVIATRWNYNAEIIRNGIDGMLVDVGSIEQLIEAMEAMVDNQEKYAHMRLNCLERCREYLPQNAITTVLEHMDM